MSSAFNTPWKIRNHLLRVVTTPWIRGQFLLAGVPWPEGAHVFGTPILQRHRQSTIEIGARISLRSSPRSNPLSPSHPVVLATRSPGAVLKIGQDCGLTGARLVAAQSIALGNRVLVGSGATIIDTDFHPLSPDGRNADMNAGDSAPIVIEDDVFIGMGALILKGVHIGSGAVVGAGSVVTKDVPSRKIVAGNPAKVVGEV